MVTHPVLLHVDIKITEDGILIGQCKEFPAVIVQANTKEELIKEMKDGIEGLYEVFPKEFASMAAKNMNKSDLSAYEAVKKEHSKKKSESLTIPLTV